MSLHYQRWDDNDIGPVLRFHNTSVAMSPHKTLLTIISPQEYRGDMPPSGTDDADTNDDADTTKNILIKVPKPEWDSLQGTKQKCGFTWKGMLRYAQLSIWRDEKTRECHDETLVEDHQGEDG